MQFKKKVIVVYVCITEEMGAEGGRNSWNFEEGKTGTKWVNYAKIFNFITYFVL